MDVADFVELSQVQMTPADGVRPSGVPPGNENSLTQSSIKNAAAFRTFLSGVFTTSSDTDAAVSAIAAYTRINGDNVYRSVGEYRKMPLHFWSSSVLLSAVPAQVLYSALQAVHR